MSEVEDSRVRSLSQLCLRVISTNINDYQSLGDLPYRLVKPILEKCTPEALLQFEKASPHLKAEDQEIWEDLCYKHFGDVRRAPDGSELAAPKSWRKHFVVCREQEAIRVEVAGARLREKYQRLEASKRDRQLIFTDNVPPMKRQKMSGGGFTWGATKPRTLFDKARSSAKKIKAVYRGPPIQPSPASWTDSSSSSSSSTSSFSLPSSLAKTSTPYPLIPAPKSRVVQRPMPGSATAHRSLLGQLARESEATQKRPTVVVKTISKTMVVGPTPRAPPTLASILAARARPSGAGVDADSAPAPAPPLSMAVRLPPPARAKTSAANALFMPKNRAYSQLPSRART
ncbi:hypothetical protein BOTBODRAFT_149386 [Botryobasidium botryosum FD-172 SS1]|uniref:Elongin-A n=1 Tax=Botryobasidium botryosum (strain FD-172 SS1) TaxID=930990 RepID=A0A067M5A7_BOTB1|nr:hypothetical protein BOTBODRAFT_149386 [Botryobasidium botryosum FD-172 SS1]